MKTMTLSELPIGQLPFDAFIFVHCGNGSLELIRYYNRHNGLVHCGADRFGQRTFYVTPGDICFRFASNEEREQWEKDLKYDLAKARLEWKPAR